MELLSHEQLRTPHGEFLLDLPGDTDYGVEDVLAVQDEDAEDEEALAGGEDDVQREHDLVGAGVGVERLRGQAPHGEGEVRDHGGHHEEEEEGVSEDLWEVLDASLLQVELGAAAHVAPDLGLRVGGGLTPRPLQSHQPVRPSPGTPIETQSWQSGDIT